jgi:hypothetical protein
MTATRSRLISTLALAAVLAGASAAFAADAPGAGAPAPAVVPPAAVAAPAVKAPATPAPAAHTATVRAVPDVATITSALEQSRTDLTDKKYRDARSVLSSTVVHLQSVRKSAPHTERAGIAAIIREVKGARVALRHGEHKDALTRVDAALVAIKALPAGTAAPTRS